MNRALIVLLAAGAAWAQPGSAAPPARQLTAQLVTPATAKSTPVAAPAPTLPHETRSQSPSQRIPLAVLDNLKKTFDGRLQAFDANAPIDLLGLTQGVYVGGYGAVFATELSPVVVSPLSPFHTKITEQEKIQVHQRMLLRIPAIRNLMQNMIKDSAKVLNLMPDDQQIVVAVRFSYLPWEDRTGLPDEIVMKADRRTALAGGPIQTQEEPQQ